MDLLLLNPHSRNPYPLLPLGLASLAAGAHGEGASLEVVDAWAEGLATPAELLRRLRAASSTPRVVGVSVFTANLPGARAAVACAREAFPKALLVVGGPHVSALPGTVLDELPGADLAVVGEGEVTLLDVMRRAAAAPGLPLGVAGTVWREGGRSVAGPPREPILNLDSLPRPLRTAFPLERYHPHPPYGRRLPYTNEITSRGCPFRCAYCAKEVFGATYRARSPARVVEDLQELKSAFGIRELHFYDDDMTLDRARSKDLFQRMAAARLDMIWSCTTRADLVDPELLGLMRAAGCWMISYGVESASDELRATVNKGVTLAQIEAAFAATRAAGLRATAYLMIGLPGETEATVRATMDLADRLDPDYVQWAVMTVYPGSPFHRDIAAGKYGPGRIVAPDAAAGESSPFQDSLAYQFEGALDRSRMAALAREATRRFYLTPRRLLRVAADLRSWAQLRQTAGAGWNMLRWLLGGR